MVKAAKKSDREFSQEEIRKGAEEIYKERVKMNKPGDALTDWQQAEKNLKKNEDK